MRIFAYGRGAARACRPGPADGRRPPNGFEVRHSINMVIPAEQAFAAFGQIGDWWSKDHTYSGDAAPFSLQLRPGGCFCERLDDGGGIEHLRVAYVQPGERVVLTGALGPLLFEATTGVMDVRSSASPAGRASP